MEFVAVRAHFPIVGMSLPEKRRLALASERESATSNQYDHLLHLRMQTLHEIGQISIFSVCNSLIDYILRKLRLKSLQMYKTDIRHLAMKRSQIFTHVDARQVYDASLSFQLIEIHPCRIKTTEVVYHSHLELKREIRLQKQALETLHGIRCRVRLRERIASERLYLPPHLTRHIIAVTS